MTFWWSMWGQRLPKLPKLPNVSKNVQSSKFLKQHFQGLANKVPVKECVRVFCVCQSVVPASPGLFRPRGLVQPCPAFPSLLQLTPARPGSRSLPQLPRGPGRVLSFRELPREVTGPRSLDSAQGYAQEEHMAIFTSSP